jgi:hypothetical protein
MKKIFLILMLLLTYSINYSFVFAKRTVLEKNMKLYVSKYHTEYRWLYDGIYKKNHLDDKCYEYLNAYVPGHLGTELAGIAEKIITRGVGGSVPEITAEYKIQVLNALRLYLIAKQQGHDCYIDFFSGGQVYIVGLGNTAYETKEGDVNLYKIHLMPKEEMLETVWAGFLRNVKDENVLKMNIDVLKIFPESEHELSDLGAPRIVLYISGGVAIAQKVLDKIYELYKDNQGSGRKPDFNGLMTSFICVAQGDRNIKERYLENVLRPAYDKACQDGDCDAESGIFDAHCADAIKKNVLDAGQTVDYELPDLVYYSQEYGSKKLGYQIPDGYFHLKNPATK